MANREDLLRRVQEILFREWDPLGVNHHPHCRDEYDPYAVAIVKLLLAAADDSKIESRLHEFQRSSMGLSRIDEERDRRVVKQIRAAADSKRGEPPSRSDQSRGRGSG